MNFPGLPPRKLSVNAYHRTIAVDVARHEAGHYIVGRALGLSMGKISVMLLDLHGAHRGMAAIDPIEELSQTDDLVDWLGHRIKQLYAGVLAQALGVDERVDMARAIELSREGGQDDYGRAQLLVHIIRNIRLKKPASQDDLETQLRSIHEPLWKGAADMVEADARLIIGLGEALGRRVTETNEEYAFTKAELLAMPDIQARFPNGAA